MGSEICLCVCERVKTHKNLALKTLEKSLVIGGHFLCFGKKSAQNKRGKSEIDQSCPNNL